MPDRARENTSDVDPSAVLGPREARPPSPRTALGPAVETYELHLTRRDGVVSFEPLTCRPLEIVTRVRARLVDGDCVCADVRQAGRSLFILEDATGP